MKTSEKGLQLIASFEGLKLVSYRCPANVLTIGYGHTGKDVVNGMEITKERALQLLAIDVQIVENQINALNLKINQNQFDALVSFAYNCGFGALKGSTLLKCVQANPMNSNIKGEFAKWNRAGGKVLPGLSRRREAEAVLYFSN